MKILINGGNGFIGRNLTELLGSEYDIVARSSSELNLLDTGGVHNYLREMKFDVVIHTATYDAAPRHSAKDPDKVFENNLLMYFNVARCQDYFGKMLYFGSGAEFGREFWRPKMNEEYFDKHVPVGQYDFSKYIMTKHAELTLKIYNLRIFSAFGKYEDWRYRFISKACCQALFGMPIVIKENVSYDFLYINDLAGVVKWFIENDPREHVYNVCSGEVYDFKALAGKVLMAAGKNLDIVVESEGFNREYSGDISRLLKEFKDFRPTPVEDSIRELYNWYGSHRDIIDRKEL